MDLSKQGSGEGAEQLNIILALTRAVNRNADKRQLKVFVKAWIYEVLDLPDYMNHIAAGLFILVKETNISDSGLKELLKKCEKKLEAVPQDEAKQLAKYYESMCRIDQ